MATPKWDTVTCLFCLMPTFPEHVHLRCPSHPKLDSTVARELHSDGTPVFVSKKEAFFKDDRHFRDYRCHSGEGCTYGFHCPRKKCGASLELSLVAKDTTPLFVLVGPPQSGKSVFLASVKRDLESHAIDASVEPASQAEVFWTEVEALLAQEGQRAKPGMTKDRLSKEEGTYRTFGLAIHSWDVVLPIIDPQGEDYQWEADQAPGGRVESRLRRAQGILLMLDPTRDTNLSRHLVANLDQTAEPSRASGGEPINYSLFIQRLHGISRTVPGQPADIPLCIVVTKADRLIPREKDSRLNQEINAIFNDLLNVSIPQSASHSVEWEEALAAVNASSERFASLLESKELESAGVVNRTRHCFRSCAFFPITCLEERMMSGDSLEGKTPAPKGVRGPILWVMGQHLRR